MRSSLGAYSEIVAAGVAAFLVAAAVLSRPLGFVDPFLDSLAILSVGAIFGSTATANGVKAGQTAIVDKLDAAAAAVITRDVIRDAASDRAAGGDDQT